MTLCIYHGNCADGFGAAWVVRHALGDTDGEDVEFHAGVYQNPPPDVTGRDVLLVDFSYKLPVLKKMGSAATSLLILDHHKSAAEDLAEVPALGYGDYEQFKSSGGFAALFDMDRSGAGITWDYFNPGKPRPQLINHIEDRDLWRFKLDGTREIQAALFSYPYDFEIWDMLMDSDPDELRHEGQAIERKHHKDIAELLDVTRREMRIGGHVVPVANLPYTLSSDAGHEMAKGNAFAACYWLTPESVVFSLRSADDGLDVSEVAKAYGGGGHQRAAGFRISVDQFKEMI